MFKKSENLIHSDASTSTQSINNLLPCFNMYSKLFQSLNSLKPSKFKRTNDPANTFEKVKISIPAKINHIAEMEYFMDNLYEHLSGGGMLFYRVKVATLETVRCIILLNKRRDRNIEVTFVKMRKKIEITISCASKNKKHYAPFTPLPCNEFDLKDRGARFFSMKCFSDRISFFGEGTGVVLIFRRSARAKKNNKFYLANI